MMARRLIIIEGLPGSGKSTVAKMVADILLGVQVLQERKKLETQIYHLLQMHKVWLDNWDFNREACRRELEKILE